MKALLGSTLDLVNKARIDLPLASLYPSKAMLKGIPSSVAMRNGFNSKGIKGLLWHIFT
jgi:hypothetical protein